MRDDRLTPRGAVAHTVLSAVVVTVLVAATALAWTLSLARQQTREAAEATARAVAATIVQPLVTPELVSGDSGARRRLQQAVDVRLRDGSIARVKLWSSDGRVVFSDEPRLVGRRFPEGPRVTTAAMSAVSTLGQAENLYERVFPQLVEVYVPLGPVGDTELVFEAYFPVDGLAVGHAAAAGTVVALAAGLTLLLAVQVPQTLRLTRRLSRHEEEVRRGLDDVRAQERERLASGMRDGVLQDLAGVGYLLDSVGPDLTDEDARELVARAGEVLRADLSLLRRLAHGDVGGPLARG